MYVGYSFGSWCGYRHLIHDPAADAFVAIGLPANRYPFEEIGSLRVPMAVVQGSEDEFGTPDEVRAKLAGARPEARVHVVEGAPHLFPRMAPDAAREVVAATLALLEVDDA